MCTVSVSEKGHRLLHTVNVVPQLLEFVLVVQDLDYDQSQELAIRNCWVTGASYLSPYHFLSSVSLRQR